MGAQNKGAAAPGFDGAVLVKASSIDEIDVITDVGDDLADISAGFGLCHLLNEIKQAIAALGFLRIVRANFGGRFAANYDGRALRRRANGGAHQRLGDGGFLLSGSHCTKICAREGVAAEPAGWFESTASAACI